MHLAVLQRDLESAQSAPGCDIAAHHAGTDHMHMGDAVFLTTQRFQALHQEEDTGQVACSRPLRQFGHGVAFLFQGGAHRHAARASPRVDQAVGRRIMGFAGFACHLFGQHSGQNLPGQPAIAEPRRRFLLERALDAVFDEFNRFVDHKIRCGHRIDQADGARGFAGKSATGQHHVEGRRCADQAGKAYAAAPARVNAELHFRQADAGTGIVRGHPCAAGQTELRTATHAVAVDQGNRGAGQFGNALENVLTVTDGVEHGSLGIEFGEFSDIGTGDEAGFFGGTDDQPFRRCEGHAFQQAVKFIEHGLTQGIDAGILAFKAE